MIKKDNFIITMGWMLTDLHLSGIELQIYAIIYGFSQDGQTQFTGSLSYLIDWTGKSKPTVLKNLSNLVEKGLIIKEDKYMNNIKFCSYRANMAIFNGGKETLPVVKNNLTGGKETLPGVVKKLYRGGKETLPNNIDYNIEDNIYKETIKKKNENKTSFFQNSEVYKLVQLDENNNILDISKLKELFKENGAEKIDFAYYFKAIDDWTLQKPIKRTNRGWIATFRTFIRKDKDANKLHIYDPFNQPDFDLKAACEKYNL